VDEKTVVPRIAAFLQREARAGIVDGWSHQEIGERLGIHRETATFALNELKGQGLSRLAGGECPSWTAPVWPR
jgi:CRP-like cAMP-binding protein